MTDHPVSAQERLAALRHALRIGAVSHDGDGWYAKDAGIADYDEGEQAFKDAFAMLDAMEKEAETGVPAEPGAPDPLDLTNAHYARTRTHGAHLHPGGPGDGCPEYVVGECVIDFRRAVASRPVPAPEPSALREAAQTFVEQWGTYRESCREAHVWSPADETMWTAGEPLRAALATPQDPEP